MPADFRMKFCGLRVRSVSDLQWMIIDSEGMTNLDYSAARVVRQLHQHLASRGVVVVFVRVHPEFRKPG
jgi:MFS superfamily sulfate permease-like transporter